MKQESTYLYLRNRIMDFSLVPGEILSENALSVELGISRSPLRDSLAQLEEEGWVVVYPQRGTYVSFLSVDNIKNHCFIRKNWDFTIFEILCTMNLDSYQKEEINRMLVEQRYLLSIGKGKEVLLSYLDVQKKLYTLAGHEQAWDLLQKFSCDMLRVCFLQMQATDESVYMMVSNSWDNIIIEYQSLVESIWEGDIATVYMINKRNIDYLYWMGESFRQLYPHYYYEF